jgi:putative membrane protein
MIASILLSDFDGHMDWDGGWGVLMVIGMLLFWVLVIAAVVWVVRELTSQRGSGGLGGTHARADDPLQILDRRLADGSISPEDYQARRAILTGTEQPPEPSA